MANRSIALCRSCAGVAITILLGVFALINYRSETETSRAASCGTRNSGGANGG